MKTPNQGIKTKIFRGIWLTLGYGARCGAAASGEFGSKLARTRAVEAVFGARPAKWRLLARSSGEVGRNFCGDGSALGDCGGGTGWRGGDFLKNPQE